MVLKAKNAQVPGFETDNDTAVAEAPAAPVVQDTSAVSATTAIAKAATTSMATPTKPLRFTAAYDDYEGAAPDVEFGMFKRVKPDLGGFEVDSAVIGASLQVEMLSWNYRYVVGPGTDNKEANALVRFSKDGVNLDDGSGTITDYLRVLKDVHGYDNASKKKYIDMLVVIQAIDGDPVPEDDQEMYLVQLSPQSVLQFGGFRANKGRLAKGNPVSPVMTLNVARGLNGTNKYAYVTFK